VRDERCVHATGILTDCDEHRSGASYGVGAQAPSRADGALSPRKQAPMLGNQGCAAP
jgi:hypothetical protein